MQKALRFQVQGSSTIRNRKSQWRVRRKTAKIMTSIPQLGSNRLILRALSIADVPAIVEYAGAYDVAKMTLNIPHPYPEESAHWWINHSHEGFNTGERSTFAIERKEDGQFMGGMGIHISKRDLKATAGYWIGKPFWGHGYATESLKRIIKYGFEEVDGLNRIQANHLIDNLASGRVMEKAGMKQEAILEDYYQKDGKGRTVVQYRILKREWDPNSLTLNK